MSAAAESSLSADKAQPDENSRLEQPRDAVAMQSIPEPCSQQSPVDLADSDKISAKSAAEPISPTVFAQTDSDNSGQSTVVPLSPKGKDKEIAAPQPPIKQDSSLGIRSAVEDAPDSVGELSDGPVCNVTLLLTSGSRHPYKIDAKYLNRRNVDIPEKNEYGQPDPFSISIYTLKELILREWRSDWEAKPASPSSIRLIHFGKLLDDKEQLKTYQLSTEGPNVVHMSIRPQDIDEEEPRTGNKNHSSSSGDGHRSREGGCCVVL